MTEAEATVVAKIMLTADHWCGTCGDSLLDQMVRAFPDVAVAVNRVRYAAPEIHQAHKTAEEASYEEPYPDVPDVWLLPA